MESAAAPLQQPEPFKYLFILGPLHPTTAHCRYVVLRQLKSQPFVRTGEYVIQHGYQTIGEIMNHVSARVILREESTVEFCP